MARRLYVGAHRDPAPASVEELTPQAWQGAPSSTGRGSGTAFVNEQIITRASVTLAPGIALSAPVFLGPAWRRPLQRLPLGAAPDSHQKGATRADNLLERFMFTIMAKYLVPTILTGAVLLLLVYVVDEVRGV